MYLSVQDTGAPAWGATRFPLARQDDATVPARATAAAPSSQPDGANAPAGWAAAPAATYTPSAVTGPTSEDFQIAAKWATGGNLPASLSQIAGIQAKDKPRWLTGTDATPGIARQASLASALKLAAFKRDAAATAPAVDAKAAAETAPVERAKTMAAAASSASATATSAAGQGYSFGWTANTNVASVGTVLTPAAVAPPVVVDDPAPAVQTPQPSSDPAPVVTPSVVADPAAVKGSTEG